MINVVILAKISTIKNMSKNKESVSINIYEIEIIFFQF